MRNLVVLNHGKVPADSIVDCDFDPVSDALVCILQSSSLLQISQIAKDGTTSDLLAFESDSNVVSFKCFPELAELAVVLENGDIILGNHEQNTVEIVGLLDAGILAARWAPDETAVTIITKSHAAVTLSRDFEPLWEHQIDSADDSESLSQNVSVGWGKSETQFRGKGARALEREKTALRHAGLSLDELRDPTLNVVERGILSDNDDASAHISWRGDSDYVSVSNQTQGARRIRVFDRDGALYSVSEPVDALEPPIAWRPLGPLISAVRKDDVIFFEKNGLRHGEFHAPNVTALHWSCGSDVLALQGPDAVLFWTCKNAHWYLKQTVRVKADFVRFHPEKPLRCLIGSSDTLHIVDFAYTTSHNGGTVAVIDGKVAKITPFSVANVPPPMAFEEVDFEDSITAIATKKGAVAALTNGVLKLWTGLMKDVAAVPGRQIAFVGDKIAVLGDELSLVGESGAEKVELPKKAVLLKSGETSYVELVDGSVYEIGESLRHVGKLPSLCEDFDVEPQGSLVFGLTSRGKLHCNSQLVASGVSSFRLTLSHLLFTSVRGQLCFVHFSNCEDPAYYDELLKVLETDERVREIERGLLLVTCVEEKSLVVLQAPRGNLETVSPRIMLLNQVRRFIDAGNYNKAFHICRTHRIDLDLLHDYDPARFASSVEEFVVQIDKAEYIDLFLSCLIDENVAQTKYKDSLGDTDAEAVEGKVNAVCNALLEVLKDKPHLLQCRFTALACQKPPNLEGALSLVEEIESGVDELVTHLCFLLDSERLYTAALEHYNLRLALMFAEKSQMDPKEYIPFLQELDRQGEVRRKFMLDDHLKRRERALRWALELDFGEFKEYTVKHALYKSALALVEGQQFDAVMAMYAEWLRDQGSHVDAALAFEYLGRDEALESYVAAKRWREAVSLLKQRGQPLAEKAEQMARVLEGDHRYGDAAEIRLHVLHEHEAAVALFCKAYRFGSALLVASEQPGTVRVLDEGINEQFGNVAEFAADCKAQLEAQLRRLRELRERREERGGEEVADDVSVVASEALTASFLTRYTGKTRGTAQSGALRRTAKNKRREERKRAQGRKGTVYEEEYLLQSVGRLAERLNGTAPDAAAVVEALVRRGRVTQARRLQRDVGGLFDYLGTHMDEIYAQSAASRQRVGGDGQEYYVEAVARPRLAALPRVGVVDF